jgi:hypothetical protein
MDGCGNSEWREVRTSRVRFHQNIHELELRLVLRTYELMQRHYRQQPSPDHLEIVDGSGRCLSDQGRNEYLGITEHWCIEDFQLQSTVLNMQPSKDGNTYNHLTCIFERALTSPSCGKLARPQAKEPILQGRKRTKHTNHRTMASCHGIQLD